MTALLETRHLTKEFGTGMFNRGKPMVALEDISLAIDETPPTITAIVGESGSGKTTFARLILGLTEPTRGEVCYRGVDLRKLDREQRRQFLRDVQVIFQDPYEVYNPFYKVDHVLTTPIEKFYIRNNGQIPEAAKEPDKWKFTVEGEVNKKLELTLGELKAKYKAQTRRMVLECGGNGRSFFSPKASGNQWTNGGAGCAEWTGVRLADVLKEAGVKPSGIYTAHYAADLHLSGDATKPTLSRGVRIAKAMDPDSMIVWAMNGQPLPNIHGGPVRLLIPGWAGSASQKWLTRIVIRDKEHDGPGMTGTSYRLTINPMVPGTKADPKNFKILESMPVRSIITSPANGTKLPAGTREVKLRGASWAGDLTVKRVDVSTDYGMTWQSTKIEKPKNRYDWQRWTASVKLPRDGYYEVWARAMDSRGQMQPHVAPNWNPSGYGGNPMHRIAVLIG